MRTISVTIVFVALCSAAHSSAPSTSEILNTNVSAVDAQSVTLAEAAKIYQKAFSETAGVEVGIFLSPDAALYTEESGINVRDMSIESCMRLFELAFPIEAEWRDGYFLIGLTDVEASNETEVEPGEGGNSEHHGAEEHPR